MTQGIPVRQIALVTGNAINAPCGPNDTGAAAASARDAALSASAAAASQTAAASSASHAAQSEATAAMSASEAQQDAASAQQSASAAAASQTAAASSASAAAASQTAAASSAQLAEDAASRAAVGDVQGIGAIRSLGLLSDGLVRLDLRELEDAGGGELVKILRDGYGRVAGTSSAEAPQDGKQYARKDGGWEEVQGSGGIPDAPSDGNTYGRKNSAWEQVAAGGDVVGPASAVADRVAVFDGATGKLLKDGGLTVADLYFDTISAPAISAGTVTLNCNSGRVRNFTISMTDNATLAVSNLAPAGRVTEFECLITQDATGARTLTLPASFRPLGGSDTAIAAAAGAKTVLSAKTFDAGATWLYAMQEVG